MLLVNAAVNLFISTHVDLQSVLETLTVHQLYADSSAPGHLLYREISCFCQGMCTFCSCFYLKTFQFELPENDSAQPALGIQPVILHNWLCSA